MQQQKRATISIFQGSMVAWCWLQNCTEVSKFTEHLEPHTASDGTLYSSLVFSDSVCLQNWVFSPPPLSLLLSWAGLQCFHLVIIRFKGTLLFFLVSPISCTCGQLWCVCLVSSSWMQQRFSLFKYVLTEMSQKSFVSNLKFSSVFSAPLQFMSWFSCNQKSICWFPVCTVFTGSSALETTCHVTKLLSLAVKWRVICSSNCL